MGQPRHRKVLETIGAGVAALALVLAPLVATGTAATAADPVSVFDIDFNDGTTGSWTPSGDVQLDHVDVDGDTVLEVSDRREDFGGIESPAFTTVAGATYTFSMRAKLPEGTEGTAALRFVAKPAYTWIGNTTIDAEDWTTVTGTWTAPDSESHTVYIGSSHLSSTPAPGEDEPSEPYTYLVDDLQVTAVLPDAVPPGDGTSLQFDFEDGTLQGWAPRATEDGPATVGVVEGGHESGHAAQVSDRLHQGQGLQLDVTDELTAGQTYVFEAWMRFDGTPGDLTLSRRVETGGESTYNSLLGITGVTEDWTRVTGNITIPAYETALEIYFETAYDGGNPGNTSTFLVDDISITSPTLEVEDLTPLQETVPFPLGVAVDERELSGAAGELTDLHFNQLTGENHMKPYAWYDAERNFRIDPQATAIMDAAAANDLRVYGHVLVWHSQNAGQTDASGDTPANPGWFFLDESGAVLTSSADDQAILRERLRTHIFAIAENLHDTYGDFGSETNPLVAWDVVNEVVADGADNPDGLRRSAWFNILGEQFIDLAFRYADEAFNEEYAAPGTDRPVKLFINDYNTEETGKQGRYFALVERLLGRGVPLDGVGHQFHVSLTRPVADLRAAIERFEALPVLQAVTELDVATGTPVTDAKLIEQGYYYRDAFELFREKADSLFSVTVWGLYDGRSWVNDNGAPLLFDDSLRAKPAYYGAAGLDLPAPIPTADAFAGGVPLDDDAFDAVEWLQLRPHPLGDEGASGAFQLRWSPDTLTVLAEVAGDAPGVEIQVGEDTYAFARDGSGDVDGVVSDIDGGWAAVIHVPLDGAAQGDILPFNLVVDGGDGWTRQGSTGLVTLLEELSYLEVAQAQDGAPEVDGEVDEVWEGAGGVVTAKQVSGTGTATAQVRTLWEGDDLYVLMEVTDPVIDLSPSSPWEKDSVEIYVDAGNNKNGGYLPTDAQLRVDADNVVTAGNAAQVELITSATSRTADGYLVEARISLQGLGGAETVHGLDFQVNDASGGSRIGITNWADPTGQGYQSTNHWGVGRLVEGTAAPVEPSVSLSSAQVRAGEKLQVSLAGFEPGAEVAVVLGSGVTATGTVRGAGAAVAPAGTTLLGTVTVGAGGTAVVTVTVPAGTPAGTYLLGASVGGQVVADAVLTVVAAAPGTGGPNGSGVGTGSGTGGGLAVTGTGLGLAGLALLVIAAGAALVVARRRGMTFLEVRQTLLRR
ncbi:Endo-1,4-beta-xylanase [Cellulomonas flavigena DSM 20109]|uniref:Beta-xylanase n=1 Tax=Cellulomonas flavigena (strain ATCC 482 / DSM 20109 / BCRC 11376 / JCM 18109 / NBRC 3775 / NCIMB 8073 / NRS 134) TaxID=446466 RepID=D5UIQ2_CELFN|nr:endo-1,4-beta-xylanase [Cellulomonas flavigena]ADG73551.1 Endo-1,4-beta-xylanase [Cellulomonas flavigena DSM 20109]